MHRSAPLRRCRGVLIVAVALASLTACSTGGSSDADGPATSTTTTITAEATTTSTTTTDTPATTTTAARGPEVDLDCGSLADDGPPEPAGSFTVPAGPVSYTAGHAVVLLTPSGDDQRCLDLQLATDSSDDQLLDPTEQSLDLRWEDGELAFEVSVTATPIAEGPIDSFTRVEVNGQVWVDSLHNECEVSLTALDDSSVDGTVTCDALSPFSGEQGPVAVVGAFHAEA